MDWFRSNSARIAWLAYFALACQFALTFGHVHLSKVGVVSAALAISADSVNGSAGARSRPAQRTPAGLAQDFCAACNNVNLANALVLPVRPAVILSILIVHDLRWPLVAIGFASHDHIHFNARGPPTPDLAT